MVWTARPRPVDLVSPWPHGDTRDPAGLVTASFAQRLLAVMANRSVRSVAVDCQVNHQTIYAILAGEVWPDMYTIASLEAGLRSSLWPAMTALRHRPGDVGGSV